MVDGEEKELVLQEFISGTLENYFTQTLLTVLLLTLTVVSSIIEIVSERLGSSEAKAYLETIKSILQYKHF